MKPTLPSLQNIQIGELENVLGTQSLRDTIALKRKTKRLFNYHKNPTVLEPQIEFWNGIPIKPQGGIIGEIKTRV